MGKLVGPHVQVYFPVKIQHITVKSHSTEHDRDDKTSGPEAEKKYVSGGLQILPLE